MLESIWKEYLLEQLSDQLGNFNSPPTECSSLPDKWLALSLLQKAIRRGDCSQALRAAFYLYHFDYRILWRRLVVIGWEDIGVGNSDLCFTVTAAAGSKRWREAQGGDWNCAAYLTLAMCRSVKDRTIDDLIEVAQYGLRYETQRNEFYNHSFERLLDVIRVPEFSLPVRMIAAWYMCGTERYGFQGLRRRNGDIARYFHSASPLVCREHITDLCRIGVSRSSTLLPIFLPLFWSTFVDGDYKNTVRDDSIKLPTLNGIPRYAYDGFTRAGQRYLKKVSVVHDELHAFLEEALPKSEHNVLIRNMYFRIESAQCDKRLDWPIGLTAHEQAGEVGFGLDRETYRTGVNLLRKACRDIPMTEADL